MKNFFFIFFLFFLSISLTACQPLQSNSPSSFFFPPFSAGNDFSSDLGQDPLQGLWGDPNGMLSSFYNGVFETHAPDTDEKLSEGNYTIRSNGWVDIDIRSLIRGTRSHTHCRILGEDASFLSCTADNGTQFMLERHTLPVEHKKK